MVDIYELALSRVKGLGFAAIKRITATISAREIYSMSKEELLQIFSGKEKIVEQIQNHYLFDECEKQLDFIQKNNIRSYFINNEDYPRRLYDSPEPPACLFVDGQGDLSPQRAVAIVGSRLCTDYGRRATAQIVEALQRYNVTIVSGLAKGIDSQAHTNALKYGAPTFGVVGHGLEMIYPKENSKLAQQMKEEGGVITEFFNHAPILPANFPRRNRIIAGLCDATIVVEAAYGGGALITAHVAKDYHRKVLAVPGRMDDDKSQGCNFLIEKGEAQCLSSVSNLAYLLGWEKNKRRNNTKPAKRSKVNTPTLPNIDVAEPKVTLPGKKGEVYSLLQQNGAMDVDSLSIALKLNVNELSSLLLHLELEDYVEALPGCLYRAL